jgi:hypothetical protein
MDFGVGTNADLIKIIVQKLSKNPSLIASFCDLHHGNYEYVPSAEVDSKAVVDT